MLVAKALLLLDFFWTCLLLSDLMKTDGKGKKKDVALQNENPSIPATQGAHGVMCIRVVHPWYHVQSNLFTGQRVLFWLLCPVSDQHAVPILSFPTQVHFLGYWLPESLHFCLLSDSGCFASPFQLSEGICEAMISFLSRTVRSSSRGHLSIHIFKFYLTIYIIWILVLFWQFIVNISWCH